MATIPLGRATYQKSTLNHIPERPPLLQGQRRSDVVKLQDKLERLKHVTNDAAMSLLLGEIHLLYQRIRKSV